MDLTEIMQFISNMGFPIAMCVYMTYALQKTNESHKAEIDELRKTIENNTIAIVKLVENFDKE